MTTPPLEAPRPLVWSRHRLAASILTRYAVALLAVAGAALLKQLLLPVFDAPTGLFYLAVATAAWYGGLYPGLFAAAVSLVASDLFFDFKLVPLRDLDSETALRAALFVLVSAVLSMFSEALHRSRRAADRAARERVAADLAVAQDLQRAAEERERLLATTRQALADAEQAARLRDEFLATVSHELRNPLNAIVGWGQVLQSGGELEAEVRQRALESIVRSARTQARLVDDLLDVARVVSGKLQLHVDLVDFGRVLEVALSAIAPLALKKDVQVEASLEPGVSVVGDAARLQQVVFNLLDNAVKFTARRGCVKVTSRRHGSHVDLVVSDDGQGIAPEFLPHVFDLFRQGDAGSRRRHGGLGLGLAIARQLVEQHAGTLAAESDGVGRGSRFTLSLPIASLGAEATGEEPMAEAPCAVPGVDLSGVSVLVLEDDADTRELLAAILAGCGARVALAASVEEALRQLSAELPHVIVSDIEMAGENGYDFIRQVRARPAEQGGAVPAAALTAYARGEDRRRALAAGFQVHAAKPLEPTELVSIVANLAARAQPRANR